MALMDIGGRYLRHHGRFYLSLVAGIIAWLLAVRVEAPPMRLILAGDVFFAAYLISTAWLTSGWTAEDMRRRASGQDEGIRIIVFITLTAIVLSLASIFFLLRQGGPPDEIEIALSIATVPLSWFTLHTVLAFHYAHRFYFRRSESPCLLFPNTTEPKLSDFLYFSFVIGMTAQVSDVQVLTPGPRQVVLAHGIVSFFFNTVILALAVNLVVGHAG